MANAATERKTPRQDLLLDIRNLKIEAKVYPPGEAPKTITLLHDVSLSLKPGKVLGLIGESGAGKSTIGLSAMAYGRGGALETVVDGVTGVLFAEQNAVSLAGAIARLEATPFAPEALVRHAASYDAAAFESRMRELLDGYWLAHQDRRHAPELARW